MLVAPASVFLTEVFFFVIALPFEFVAVFLVFFSRLYHGHGQNKPYEARLKMIRQLKTKMRALGKKLSQTTKSLFCLINLWLVNTLKTPASQSLKVTYGTEC